MQPRFTTYTSCAASLTTISSALRPDGNVNVAMSIHGGRFAGARF